MRMGSRTGSWAGASDLVQVSDTPMRLLFTQDVRLPSMLAVPTLPSLTNVREWNGEVEGIDFEPNPWIVRAACLAHLLTWSA